MWHLLKGKWCCKYFSKIQLQASKSIIIYCSHSLPCKLPHCLHCILYRQPLCFEMLLRNYDVANLFNWQLNVHIAPSERERPLSVRTEFYLMASEQPRWPDSFVVLYGLTIGSWDNSQNSPAVQALPGLTLAVGLGWGKADLLKLQLQLTSPSPHTWAPAPWKRNPSNDNRSCREGFLLVVADSDFRAVGIELESSTEGGPGSKWRREMGNSGEKGLDFLPLTKMCFAIFVFSSGLVSFKIFSL